MHPHGMLRMLNGTAKDIHETSKQLILGTEHSATKMAARNRCWSGNVWVLQRPDICEVHPVYIQVHQRTSKYQVQRVSRHALERSFLFRHFFFRKVSLAVSVLRHCSQFAIFVSSTLWLMPWKSMAKWKLGFGLGVS